MKKASQALLVIIVLLVAGCVPRGVVQINPAAANVGQVTRVFAATSRERDPATVFGNKRSLSTSYSRFDVSIPPNHKVGKVEWPGVDPDPEKDFFTTDAEIYQDESGFVRDVRREFSRLPRSKRVAVIYIHGFNYTFSEGVYRAAQLSYDFKQTEVAFHYSWPSAANSLGYVRDRDSALFARDGLEDFLRAIKKSGAEHIVVVGHSIGAFLTMEALRQVSLKNPSDVSRLFDSVILLSPDIDLDVFKGQVRKIDSLPDPFIIVTSATDRALRLSARLTGQKERLGNLQDIGAISEYDITVLDLSRISDGDIIDHFKFGTSPTAIGLLSQVTNIETFLASDSAGRIGLLPGVALTVQNATKIVLSPTAGQPE